MSADNARVGLMDLLLDINSALHFGELYTLIVNISGTDQATDKRKTVLSTTILFHVR